MTECYACAKLAELMAENNALRGIVGDLKVPTDPGDASMMSVDAFIEKQTEHESRDTREKLEADVRKYLAIMKLEGYVFDMIYGWLDRQAAITERHILTRPDERDEQIAELQREVDRLTRENVSLARDLGECMAERDSWRYRWHQVRVLMDEPLQCDRATLVDIDGEVVG